MNFTSGLANFELLRLGFSILILIIIFCVLLYFLGNTINEHYESTTCNIVSSKDESFTQTVTYTVNNKEYTQRISPSITTYNNKRQTNYAFPEGQHTIYYTKNNPNIYSINTNPVTIIALISGGVFVVIVLTVLWFLFLRSHHNVAAIEGGIDVASTVLSRF